MGCNPVVEIAGRDAGEGRVQLDTDDLPEGKLAGYHHGSGFAGSYVEECVFIYGVGWVCPLPECDEGAENAGGYTVVCGDVGVALVARLEMLRGDQAAGFYAVDLVEGMLRGWGFA